MSRHRAASPGRWILSVSGCLPGRPPVQPGCRHDLWIVHIDGDNGKNNAHGQLPIDDHRNERKSDTNGERESHGRQRKRRFQLDHARVYPGER